MSVKINNLGFAGLSPLDPKRVARIINNYVTTQEPVIFNIDKIDVKKVAGFYLSRAKYLDEGDSMVNILQWKY